MKHRVLGLGASCVLLAVLAAETHAAPGDIVLTAVHAVDVHGHWSRAADPSAAGGMRLASTDTGWQNVDGPLPTPHHYVDFTFVPQSGTFYRVWLRLRASGESMANDSVFVQFSNARDGSKVARYRVGTTEGLVVNRQQCNDCPLSGWGWYNDAAWLTQPTLLAFSKGSQTIRIQTREDGVEVDQIVLSPVTFRDAAPGAREADTTILPASPRVPSTPFTGAPLPIPGEIAADAFDNGGSGIAYHDSTVANQGKTGRSTAVDLRQLNSGGYAIGWITPGEWVNYTVNVAHAGDYMMEAEVAGSGTGTTMHLNFNDENLSGVITFPNTGSGTTFATVTERVTLAAGVQTMKVIFDSVSRKNAGLARIRFLPVTSSEPPDDPPSEPPPPPPPPPPPSTVTLVPGGGDLQAALNLANPGDTILLEAGATYVGNFKLPNKSGDAYITIRSAASDALLPGDGVRIDPSYAAYLPKLRSPNNEPALATTPSAHHYRLQFLELLNNVNGAGEILALGDGSSLQNTLAVVPNHLIVDRVYIHGSVTVGQKRGIGLHSAHTSIVNSYISEIKAVGQDSQAIGGWNGPGPYLISNNYLEAAGENVMFGGADPAIPDLVPSDITFTRNHLFKPWTWRGSSWTVKNLFELKSAQRVVIDSNLMENNWVAAQSGYAVLLKSVNQDGGAPWSVVQDVVFSNNIVRHVSSAINILGRDTRFPAIEANRIVIRNNLFDDVSGAKYGGHGWMLLINGGIDITVDHNTVNHEGGSLVGPDGNPTQNFAFTNNVAKHNAYGIKGTGTGVGNTTIAYYFPNSQIHANILIGGPSWMYPVGNFFPATIADVGFVDFAGGDYRLSGTSIYLGRAADGTDPGVNYAALVAAFAVAR